MPAVRTSVGCHSEGFDDLWNVEGMAQPAPQGWAKIAPPTQSGAMVRLSAHGMSLSGRSAAV